jgi:hypothetical protein
MSYRVPASVTQPSAIQQTTTPTPPPSPAPVPAPAIAGEPVTQVAAPQATSSPKAIYDALRYQRREIENQIYELQNTRREIASQLRNPNITPADAKGLEGRLATLDARLASLDKQKADADLAVSKQAAVPGSIVPDPIRVRQGPPEEVFALAGAFIFVVLMPLAIAAAFRFYRRGVPKSTGLPQEIYDRFTRVEQSLDTIAIETERVGEGQRFLTRMLADRALGAGPAERIDAGARELERQARK